MLNAGIICQIHPRDVHFVAQTVLAQKTHDGQGLPLNKLKYSVNDQCIRQGLPSEFDMPPCLEPTISNDSDNTKKPTKW